MEVLKNKDQKARYEKFIQLETKYSKTLWKLNT